MSRKRKPRGHFCWCCGRMRPNERFSRGGRARHVCRQCSRLGADELAFRQAVRDIDRLLSVDGIIRRKQRRAFERFLAHDDERVRAYAAGVAAHDAELRAEYRREAIADEEALLALFDEIDVDIAHSRPPWSWPRTLDGGTWPELESGEPLGGSGPRNADDADERGTARR